MARDPGSIAAGQLALHDRVAAFGTLRTYAARLEMQQTGAAIQRSLD